MWKLREQQGYGSTMLHDVQYMAVCILLEFMSLVFKHLQFKLMLCSSLNTIFSTKHIQIIFYLACNKQKQLWIINKHGLSVCMFAEIIIFQKYILIQFSVIYLNSNNSQQKYLKGSETS